MLILLLPPINVNTLAYFLQFLNVVSKYSQKNRMTTDNLVKMIGPAIMPVSSNGPQMQIASHVQVIMSHSNIIQLLVENANLLGVVPTRMCEEASLESETPPELPPMTDERKKKRRSGSINRVFRNGMNGFRNGIGKLVGVMTSSNENLDETDESMDDDHISTIAAKPKRRAFDKLNFTASAKKK